MKRWYFTNFPLGIFLGVVIATIAFMVLDGSYISSWDRYFTYGISALLALLGTGIATAGILANIRIDEQRRNNARQATRAALNLPLSNVIKSCKRAIEFSLNDKIPARDLQDAMQAVRVGESDLAAIRDAIEYADPPVADRLANVIRHYQVYYARLEEIIASKAPKPLPALQSARIASRITNQERAAHALNFAVLLRLTGDVFPYARGEKNTIPPEIGNKDLDGIFLFDMQLDSLTNELEEEIKSRLRRKTLELGFEFQSDE